MMPGDIFIGGSGFFSYQGTLTGAYSLQSIAVTAPAGTTGAAIQFLEAGSAIPNDAGTTRIDNVSLIPEPTSLALVGLGGLSLMLFRRQRK
jgi:hypothetical protein